MDEKIGELVKRSRPWPGLDLSVWKNSGSNGCYFTATIRTSWKKGNGFEERSVSLSKDQLLALSKEVVLLLGHMPDQPKTAATS